ncbi:MAG: hypothetical protein K2H87_01470, partial [Duncaniella sp.]|nr:hypothetical protein [Duncaniella sp.]
EYEVIDGEDGAKTTSLTRVMEYPNGTGKNTIDIKQDENGSCKFSIIVPAENDGKTFTYKFVANRDAGNKTLGSDFASTLGQKINVWASPTGKNGGSFIANGAAMTGVAVEENGTDNNSELVMTKDLKCKVNLVRTAARVDIMHEIPNLKITAASFKGMPIGVSLFPTETYPDLMKVEIPINDAVELPEKYLYETQDTKVELKKAFYVHERKNEEANCASVYIKYTVSANNKEYQGEIEVPFQSTKDQSYVDIVRNHLYTISLGQDPISGKVTATLIVDDWELIEVDEPLTDDDQEVNND